MPEPRQKEHGTRLPTPADALKRAVDAELDTLLARQLDAGLYLVATPIGHLGDVSLRALAVLVKADHVYCEDTRVSQILTTRYGISRRLRAYHEHSDADDRAAIIREIDDGRSVALISDAGTPAVSDPGFKLVRDAITGGHRVFPVPGPAAFVAAVTASGLPTDQFLFAGFLPQKQIQRRKQIQALAQMPVTLCFYESPHRVGASLADMAKALGGNRPAAIARELTKRYEEIVRGSLEELVEWSQSAVVRGEIAIIVGPYASASSEPVTDEEIAERLAKADPALSASQAAKRVAEELGVPKSRVYGVGLKSR
jgi:16S rRNA (cytidine1402-2'-O)-methyltransferase